jgi:hypothetical protein
MFSECGEASSVRQLGLRPHVLFYGVQAQISTELPEEKQRKAFLISENN